MRRLTASDCPLGQQKPGGWNPQPTPDRKSDAQWSSSKGPQWLKEELSTIDVVMATPAPVITDDG